MEMKSKRRLLYQKIFKPIRSLKAIEKEILSKRLNYKYSKFKTNITFNRYFTSKFLNKKRCHITTFFNDYLLFNKNKEYIKSLFTLEEAYKNLSRYSLIYKEYTNFYCLPMINNLFYNNLIVDCIEAKVEIFYDINFKNKEIKQQKESSEKDNGFIIYSKKKSKNEKESKNEIKKSFFKESLRKQIEQIESCSQEKIDCSKVNKTDTSLLFSSSNDNAVNQLIEELNQKKQREEIINNLKQNNPSKILNNPKIAFDNNMKKIKKLNQIYKNYKENKDISNINNKNKIEINNNSYKEKIFFKNKNNYDTIKHDKNSFHLGKNKSVLNINNSLQKSISIINSKGMINSLNLNPKIEKQKYKTIFSLKNKFSNNLKKREKITQTPVQSLIVKLNKIVKINNNNNIININIINNKKDKGMKTKLNEKKNYNLKLYNKRDVNKSNNNFNNNILNNINENNSLNKFRTNKIYSRNKHNSKSSRFLKNRKIYFNNKNIKDSSNCSLSKQNKLLKNINVNKPSIKRMILRPKANIFNKSNSITKSQIKGLNISSINNYNTNRNRNYSNKIINIKQRITRNKKFDI